MKKQAMMMSNWDKGKVEDKDDNRNKVIKFDTAGACYKAKNVVVDFFLASKNVDD